MPESNYDEFFHLSEEIEHLKKRLENGANDTNEKAPFHSLSELGTKLQILKDDISRLNSDTAIVRNWDSGLYANFVSGWIS